jgi:hypothetical protein
MVTWYLIKHRGNLTFTFITWTLHDVLLDDKMKDDDMGGAYSTHGRHEKCIQNFCRET